MFISLACSVRMLLSLKVARQVQLKCGDPIRKILPIRYYEKVNKTPSKIGHLVKK